MPAPALSFVFSDTIENSPQSAHRAKREPARARRLSAIQIDTPDVCNRLFGSPDDLFCGTCSCGTFSSDGQFVLILDLFMMPCLVNYFATPAPVGLFLLNKDEGSDLHLCY